MFILQNFLYLNQALLFCLIVANVVNKHPVCQCVITIVSLEMVYGFIMCAMYLGSALSAMHLDLTETNMAAAEVAMRDFHFNMFTIWVYCGISCGDDCFHMRNFSETSICVHDAPPFYSVATPGNNNCFWTGPVYTHHILCWCIFILIVILLSSEYFWF